MKKLEEKKIMLDVVLAFVNGIEEYQNERKSADERNETYRFWNSIRIDVCSLMGERELVTDEDGNADYDEDGNAKYKYTEMAEKYNAALDKIVAALEKLV